MSTSSFKSILKRTIVIMLCAFISIAYVPGLAYAMDEPETEGESTPAAEAVEQDQEQIPDEEEAEEETLPEQPEEEAEEAPVPAEATEAVSNAKGGSRAVEPSWTCEGEAVLRYDGSKDFVLSGAPIINENDEAFSLRIGVGPKNTGTDTWEFDTEFNVGDEYGYEFNDNDELVVTLYGTYISDNTILQGGETITLIAKYKPQTGNGWEAVGTCEYYYDEDGGDDYEEEPLSISLKVSDNSILVNQELDYMAEAKGSVSLIRIYKDYQDGAEPDYEAEEMDNVSPDAFHVLYEEPGEYTFRAEACKKIYNDETDEYEITETQVAEKTIHVDAPGETGEFAITKVNDSTSFGSGIEITRDDNVTIKCGEAACGDGVAENYWIEAYVYDPAADDGKGEPLGRFAQTDSNIIDLNTIGFEAGEYVLCVGANAPGYTSTWSTNSFQMRVNDLDVPEGDLYFSLSDNAQSELLTGESFDYSIYCPGAKTLWLEAKLVGENYGVDIDECWKNALHGSTSFNRSGEYRLYAEALDEEGDTIASKTLSVEVTAKDPLVLDTTLLPEYVDLSKLSEDLTLTVNLPEHAEGMVMFGDYNDHSAGINEETSDGPINLTIPKDELEPGTVIDFRITAWGAGYDEVEKYFSIPVISKISNDVNLSLDVDEDEKILINQPVGFTVSSNTSKISGIRLVYGSYPDDYDNIDNTSYSDEITFFEAGNYSVIANVMLEGSEEWISTAPVSVNVVSYGMTGEFSIVKVNDSTDLDNPITVKRGEDVVVECSKSDNATYYGLYFLDVEDELDELGLSHDPYHAESDSNIITLHTTGIRPGRYWLKAYSGAVGYEDMDSDNTFDLIVEDPDIPEGEVLFSLSENAQGTLDTSEEFSVDAYCPGAEKIKIYTDYDNDDYSYFGEVEDGVYSGTYSYDKSGTYRLVAVGYRYDEDEGEWVTVGESEPKTVTVMASTGENLILAPLQPIPDFLTAGEDDLNFEINTPAHAEFMTVFVESENDEGVFETLVEEETESGTVEVNIPANHLENSMMVYVHIYAWGRGYNSASIDKEIAVVGAATDGITFEASKTDVLVNEDIDFTVKTEESVSEVFIYQGSFESRPDPDDEGVYHNNWSFDSAGSYVFYAKAKLDTGDDTETWITSAPITINVTSNGNAGAFHITSVNGDTSLKPLTVKRGEIVGVEYSKSDHAENYWIEIEKLSEDNEVEDCFAYGGPNQLISYFGTAELEPGQYRFHAMACGTGYERTESDEFIYLTVTENDLDEGKIFFDVSKTKLNTYEEYTYSVYCPGAANLIIYFDYLNDKDWTDGSEGEGYTSENSYGGSGTYQLCAEAFDEDGEQIAKKTIEMTVESPNGEIEINLPKDLPEYITPDTKTVSFTVDKPENASTMTVEVWAEGNTRSRKDLYYNEGYEGDSLDVEFNTEDIPEGWMVYVSVEAEGQGYETTTEIASIAVVDKISEEVTLTVDKKKALINEDIELTVTAADSNARISEVQIYEDGSGYNQSEDKNPADNVYSTTTSFFDPGIYSIYTKVQLEGSEEWLTCQPVAITVTKLGKLPIESLVLPELPDEICVGKGLSISVNRPENAIGYGLGIYFQEGSAASYDEWDSDESVSLTVEPEYLAQYITEGMTFTIKLRAYGIGYSMNEVSKEITLVGHKLTEQPGTNPTCSAAGVRAHWSCDICGKYFLDAEGTQETSIIDLTIPATGEHTWNDGEVTTPATCTTAGVKTFTCTGCGTTRTEEIAIDPEAHSWGAWTDEGDGKHHSRVCSNDDEHVETAEHTWNDGEVTTPATCETAGVKTFTCTGCGATKTEEIPSAGQHQVDKWTVTKDATCSEAGSRTGECTVCHETVTEEIAIDPEAHSWGAWTDAGDGEHHQKVCEHNSAHTETAEHTWNNGEVTTPATCTTAGVKTFTCTGCGATKTEVIPSAGQHQVDKWTVTKDATCSEAGSRTGECTVCHETVTEEIAIDPEAHSWGAWTDAGDGEHHQKVCEHNSVHVETAEHTWNNGEVTRQATCTTAGVKTFTCTVCGATRTEEIAVDSDAHSWGAWTDAGDGEHHQRVCEHNSAHAETAEHTWNNGEITTPATCETAGVKTFTCTVCGATKTEEIPAAGQHQVEKWTVTKAATCSEAGSRTGECTICHETVTEEIAIDPEAHEWGAWTAVPPEAEGEPGHKTRTCKHNDSHVQTEEFSFDISKATVTGIANKNYTGGALKQAPKVVLDGVTLVNGTDYTVTYRNNVRIGVATVVITGKGNYSGSVSKTFQIGPKATGIANPKKAKKAFTAKWKKMTAKMVLANGKKANITGYQIQYSTSSTFAKGNKTVTVKGYKKTNKKIKAAAKTTYYVRVRTYIKVGGKTYYSSWSGKKAVKTK